MVIFFGGEAIASNSHPSIRHDYVHREKSILIPVPLVVVFALVFTCVYGDRCHKLY